jgi:hypothetical protein
MKTTKQTITNQIESEYGTENLKFSGSSIFEDGIFKALILGVTEKKYTEGASPDGEPVESHTQVGEIVFEYRNSVGQPLNPVVVEMFIDFLNELKDSLTAKEEEQ